MVELRAVPDCPNVEAARRVLRACLADAGLAETGVPVTVIERTGEYPSPSVLVDGRDVTGADPDGPAACVLRPPTAEQIRAALHAAFTAAGEAGPAAAASIADVGCRPGEAIGTDRPPPPWSPDRTPPRRQRR